MCEMVLRSLLSNEGQYPYLPGFEKIEEIRKTVLKHQFSEPGLLSQVINQLIN